MRRIRRVEDAEENARLVPIPGTQANLVMRDPVEPEPVGTVVLLPFRITGYDQDCDGSLMARLKNIKLDGEPSG